MVDEVGLLHRHFHGYNFLCLLIIMQLSKNFIIEITKLCSYLFSFCCYHKQHNAKQVVSTSIFEQVLYHLSWKDD